MPHGMFGNVIHAFTLGLFGNQVERTDTAVSSDYKVKEKKEDNNGGINADTRIQKLFGDKKQ